MTTTQSADHDISDAMTTLLDKADPARRIVSKVPHAIVAAADEMYAGDDAHYVNTGYLALQLILQSLDSVQQNKTHVHAVLDYGSGFGRVTRWLRAAFAKATLHAADSSPAALASVATALNIETIQIDDEPATPLPRTYDLIWIGSIFTHLPEDQSARVLRYLANFLSERGIIVATTHGAYVAQRIASRQKTYGVSEDAIDKLIADYNATGSAFTAYDGRPDFGVSITRPDRMSQLALGAGFETTFFKQRGWALHQDGFCFRRSHG